MSYLLGTNVLLELRKPKGDENVEAWFKTVDGYELFLSVLVMGEIRLHWAHRSCLCPILPNKLHW